MGVVAQSNRAQQN